MPGTTIPAHRNVARRACTLIYFCVELVSQDLIATLFRVELLMGRDVTHHLARHQKEKKAAELAARRKASKQGRPSNNVSKVRCLHCLDYLRLRLIWHEPSSIR